MAASIINRIRNFRSRSDGSATIESVLWFPAFMVIFALMADGAMIFSGHSRVMRVVQDANRNLSIGRLRTEEDIQDYIVTALAQLSPGASVVADMDTDPGIVTTVVTVPASDLEMLGMFNAFSSLELTITSQHFIEN